MLAIYTCLLVFYEDRMFLLTLVFFRMVRNIQIEISKFSMNIRNILQYIGCMNAEWDYTDAGWLDYSVKNITLIPVVMHNKLLQMLLNIVAVVIFRGVTWFAFDPHVGSRMHSVCHRRIPKEQSVRAPLWPRLKCFFCSFFLPSFFPFTFIYSQKASFHLRLYSSFVNVLKSLLRTIQYKSIKYFGCTHVIYF